MSPDEQVQVEIAPAVCEPCRRRKKKCDKALPVCGRCDRLFVKCSDVPASTEGGSTSGSSSGNTVLPSLIEVVPGFVSQRPSFTKNGSSPNSSVTSTGIRAGVEEQVSSQVWKLLNAVCRKRGYVSRHCTTYFQTLNKTLPVVDEFIFYEMLERGYHEIDNGFAGGECHFSALLLGIFLITHLSPRYTSGEEAGEQLYSTLKSIFSLLQSTGNLTVELIQLGVLITSWEYCQAKKGEAWMSIGSCVRMAQMLGLHSFAKRVPPHYEVERRWFENRRCVWWCVVVLERVINQDYMNSTLPYASAGPTEHDLLPLVPLRDGKEYRVRDEILLPTNVDSFNVDPSPRGFTRFGPMAATVQMTYLTDLVTQHALDQSRSSEQREADLINLDVSLQNFAGACIPPPGKAEGRYCGPYGMRTSAAFSLHFNELDMATQLGDKEAVLRATSALLQIARIIVYATRASFHGLPMDFDSIAFWSHRIVAISALVYIQFGERNGDWESDLEILKKHLRYYAPRYKIYDNYLKEIEAAQASAMVYEGS